MKLARLKLFSDKLTKTASGITGAYNKIFGRKKSKIQKLKDAINFRNWALEKADVKNIYDAVRPKIAKARRAGDTKKVVKEAAKGVTAGASSFLGKNPVSTATSFVISGTTGVPLSGTLGAMPITKVESKLQEKLSEVGLEKLTPTYWIDELNKKTLK